MTLALAVEPGAGVRVAEAERVGRLRARDRSRAQGGLEVPLALDLAGDVHAVRHLGEREVAARLVVRRLPARLRDERGRGRAPARHHEQVARD